MPRYRSTETVHAERYFEDGHAIDGVKIGAGLVDKWNWHPVGPYVENYTPDDWNQFISINEGDWVLRDMEGTYSILTDDEFKLRYELVYET